METKFCLLKNTLIDKLLVKLEPYLPDVLRGPRAFHAYVQSPTTICVIVGDWQGAFILSDIVLGTSASIHIYLWDKELRHQHDKMRTMMRLIFMFLDIERLQAQPPAHNQKACKLAEGMGFKKEGVLRKVTRYNNELQDIAIYAILKEE